MLGFLGFCSALPKHNGAVCFSFTEINLFGISVVIVKHFTNLKLNMYEQKHLSVSGELLYAFYKA